MKQFPRLDPSDVSRLNGNQRHGRSTTIDEFDLVCDTALVDVYNGAHIATMQPFVIGFSIEYNEGVLSDHSSSSGKAVTNLGGSSGSTIQTVKTRPGRYPGRPTMPDTLYFIP
jgi:hypothetical protein